MEPQQKIPILQVKWWLLSTASSRKIRQQHRISIEVSLKEKLVNSTNESSVGAHSLYEINKHEMRVSATQTSIERYRPIASLLWQTITHYWHSSNGIGTTWGNEPTQSGTCSTNHIVDRDEKYIAWVFESGCMLYIQQYLRHGHSAYTLTSFIHSFIHRKLSLELC
jgi:hypothetical protein